MSTYTCIQYNPYLYIIQSLPSGACSLERGFHIPLWAYAINDKEMNGYSTLTENNKKNHTFFTLFKKAEHATIRHIYIDIHIVIRKT